MINIHEVLETNEMIEKEKSGCAYNHSWNQSAQNCFDTRCRSFV